MYTEQNSEMSARYKWAIAALFVVGLVFVRELSNNEEQRALLKPRLCAPCEVAPSCPDPVECPYHAPCVDTPCPNPVACPACPESAQSTDFARPIPLESPNTGKPKIPTSCKALDEKSVERCLKNVHVDARSLTKFVSGKADYGKESWCRLLVWRDRLMKCVFQFSMETLEWAGNPTPRFQRVITHSGGISKDDKVPFLMVEDYLHIDNTWEPYGTWCMLAFFFNLVFKVL